MKTLPNLPATNNSPLTDTQKMANTLATIEQRSQAAGGALFAAYNVSRQWVYINPYGISSDAVYGGMETKIAGDAAKSGRMARLAKTALLDSADPTDPRIIALAADGVRVFKILDPLNPPGNLSDAAKATFAEIAAAL